MSSNSHTWRRWVAAVSLTTAVGAGLVLAEQTGSVAPVDVKTQSIARSSALTPRLPITAPSLTAPRLAVPQPNVAAPSLPTEPTIGAQGHNGQNTAICQSLLNARAAILNTPPSPARTAALAQNSAQLAFYHCAPISG